jgi:adenylylsulfate kinase-like enzyme
MMEEEQSNQAGVIWVSGYSASGKITVEKYWNEYNTVTKKKT